MAERLYNRLLRVRTEGGLTQAGLAELVGVSRKTINTVENGIFIPSTLLALKLARALGRPVEELFSLEPTQEQYRETAAGTGEVLPTPEQTPANSGSES